LVLSVAKLANGSLSGKGVGIIPCWKEGRNEGRKEGRKGGREAGRQAGRREGRRERREGGRKEARKERRKGGEEGEREGRVTWEGLKFLSSVGNLIFEMELYPQFTSSSKLQFINFFSSFSCSY